MLPTLLIICGPTAVGKTEVAIRVAKHFETEIISADSRQIYREMVIGTAAPDSEQLAEVPHHLIGHRSVKETYNVSIFEQEVLALLEILFKKHHLVVITGGSGLYLDVITKGIDDLPDIDPFIRSKLRKAFEDKGLEWLQAQVQQTDPEYWEQVDRMNPNRLLRALEVFETTSQKFSSLRLETVKNRPFRVIKTGLTLPREALNKRIDLRVDRMLEQGLVNECKGLLPFRDCNALNTVGYKEIFHYFEGKCTLDQAVIDIKTHTRRYAKRQMTWFRRDQEIRWFSPAAIEPLVLNAEETIKL